MRTFSTYKLYPYGMLMPGRHEQENTYEYGFNGMRKDDEIKDESGTSYDFGARMYDPRVGRFLCRDKFEKNFSYLSPFVFARNVPIVGTDINGDSLYILIYTKGSLVHDGDDDRMFKAAALTRQRDIETSKSFNKNTDKVVVLSVEDISDTKYRVEWATGEYSEQYGKTAEVSIYSHSGLDGPMGSEYTQHYSTDGYQMSSEGWGNIDFNWGTNANMRILGCNSGNMEDGEDFNFALNLSKLSNFKNVTVWGQKKSSYPSFCIDERKSSANMDNGTFPKGSRVYMVGSDGGLDDKFFNNAYKMTRAKNGNLQTPAFQPGKKAPTISESTNDNKSVDVKLEGGI